MEHNISSNEKKVSQMRAAHSSIVVQSLSTVQLFATPRTATSQAFLSFPISQSLLKLMSTELMMSSNHPTLCPQSFSASGSFPMSRLFTSGGQSTGASASVLPMNIQGWYPLGLVGLISVLFKELSRVQHHSWKASILQRAAFFMVQLSHDYRKNYSSDYMHLCWQSDVSSF